MDTFLFPQPMVLSGPIVQLIQTPSGATQLVTTSSSPNNNAVGGGNNGNGGGQPVVSASSNKNSSGNSSRSTKQILPKPPGNGANSQSGGSSKHNSQTNNNGSGTNNSAVNSNNNGGNHGARSLVTNMPSNVNSVGTTLTTGPLQTGPGQTTITPQILLGPPGNQKMSFITSNPPGTFLLNQVIPGLGSQPILIQGNLNNIGGPLQLTLRQQQPQSVVTVSSANGTSVSVASSQGSTPLISTLAGQTSSVQRSTHSTPTFLFSNNGPTVTGTTAPTMVMASGQHNFRGQNLIFTRPPNLIGPTGSMVQGPGTAAPTATPAQTVPQFIQIQTPNGPMLVALQTTPTLGPPNGGSPIIQTHVTPSPQAVPITSTIMPLQTSGTVGNQNASNHPTLHTILQTSSAESLNQSSLTQQSGAPLSANSLIFSQSGNVITSQSITTSTTLTPHQNQHQHQPQTPHSSSIRGNSKARKETKGLNLADLLKETGILQESSPPQSPSSITIRQTSTDGDLTNNLLSQTDITQANSLVPGTTPTMLDNSHTNQAQPTMLMVPDQGSQASNILIAPGHGMAPGTTHQLRLSLAADGSVILQPNLGPSVSTANTILSNPSITNQTGTSTQIIQDLGSTSMASISNSKFIDTLRDSCGPGSSQPSPDSTTPTLDASTPTSASTISTISLTNVKSSSPAISTIASSPVLSHKQTLMQQLNAGSTMKVGDSVTSMTITPIMGPSYRDDSKSSSPFIPLTITSESIRESTNLKTTIKQESSSKSMMDQSSTESKTEIVSVPLTDILNSNNSCISNVSVTPSSSTSTSTTTSVLTMSNCDSLVQNPSMPVLLTNASLIIPDDASTNNSNHKLSSGPSAPSNNRSRVTPTNTNNSASPLTNSIPSLSSGQPITSVSPLSSSTAPTLVDQNGFQFVQISLNNQEFIERLEAQIKNLRALKSPKEDQKKLLQELLSLQKRMSEAKIQPQSSMFGESKVILTSLSQPSHTPELLLAQPQQLQQTQQQSQQLQQLQRKPISSPGPQSLPQEIQSHLQQMFSESQHETEQHHQQTQHTSMPSLLPKTAHQQNSSQLNQPQSPNPQFNTIIKLNSSTNSNQLHPNQPQIVTATQQQAQNVRLITSNNANNLDGNTTIQVGTQLITIAASPVKPSIQSSLQTTSLQKQSSGGSNATTIQVVRIGTPNTSSSSTNNKLFKAPLESPQLENEKTKAKICRFFQQQAAADQAAATRPDTKTPFKSRSDACKRLLRYHVFNAPVPTEEQLSKVDRDFEVISESLLKRKNELFNRFRYNLLKSNMIETPKAEYVMLNKLFINDENISLQRDKDLVAQGKELELPPPPESWKKIIRDSLEEEEQLSINRKRKSSALDEDFLADCTEIKKYDIEDRESGDTDDDEDDSEDEDDEEENAAEDIAKYLGSNHHPESVPDLGYYPDFSNNPGIALPTDVNSLNNPYTQRNGTQEMAYNNEEWKGNNFVSNNRRIDVWNNRYDNENDFAVSTILEGGENGESADHETDLDLSSIQFLDLVNCHW